MNIRLFKAESLLNKPEYFLMLTIPRCRLILLIEVNHQTALRHSRADLGHADDRIDAGQRECLPLR